MKLKGWNKALNTGMSDIDAQHIQLYDFAKKFIEMNFENTEPERISYFLNHLNEGWQKHIAYEENLMLQVEYPFLSEHQAKHLEIAEEIKNFVKNSKSIAELGMSLNNLIDSWLGQHIVNEDQKFAGWFKEQSEKKD